MHSANKCSELQQQIEARADVVESADRRRIVCDLTSACVWAREDARLPRSFRRRSVDFQRLHLRAMPQTVVRSNIHAILIRARDGSIRGAHLSGGALQSMSAGATLKDENSGLPCIASRRHSITSRSYGISAEHDLPDGPGTHYLGVEADW